jgi:hypothetical protein
MSSVLVMAWVVFSVALIRWADGRGNQTTQKQLARSRALS